MAYVSKERNTMARDLLDGMAGSLRVLLPAVVVGFALAAGAWAMTITQQLPAGSVFSWTGTVLGVFLGMPAGAGGLLVALPPTLPVLGLWALIYAGAAKLRRNRAVEAVPGVGPQWTCAAGFVLPLVLGALCTGLWAPLLEPGPVGWARAGIVVCSAALVGLRPSPPAGWVRAVDGLGAGFTEVLGRAWELLRRVVVALGGAALVLIVLGIVLRWNSAWDVVEQYSAPAMAAVGLGILQLLYAPTLMAFSLAWITGAGVDLSGSATGSAYASDVGMRPGIPALALMPGQPAGWVPVLAAVVVLAGMFAVLGRRAWRDRVDWPVVGTTAVLVYVSLVLVAVFSCGGVGPGGLARFGLDLVRFPAFVTVFAMAGVCLGRVAQVLSTKAVED
nr:DUF6350 family protein [Brevibacterium sp. 68QC2CO]